VTSRRLEVSAMPRHVTQSRLPMKSQLLAASGTQAGRQPGAPAGAAGWAQLLARESDY